MNSKTLRLGPWLLLGAALLLFGCTTTSSDGGGGPTGTVTGTVIDASTGLGLSGVSVATTSGSSSATTAQKGSGENAYATTQTDSTGYFSFAVPTGTITLQISKSGYTTTTMTVTVVQDQTTDLGLIVVSASLTTGQIRVVLTWGANPSDLDLHAIDPYGEEIAYYNTIGTGINLDTDDTTSYGPETITITSQTTGNYCFFVHNYSGSYDTTFGNSGAQIQVYTAAGLQDTETAPAGSDTTTDYWNVLVINGSTLTVVNTYGTTTPTCAGGGGGGGAISLNTPVDDSVAVSADNIYVATVSPGTKYLVSLYGLSADVDLYVSQDGITNALCTIDNTLFSGTYPEDCTITATGSSLYVDVYGFAAGSYTLYITAAPTDSAGVNQGSALSPMALTAGVSNLVGVNSYGMSYYSVTGLTGTVTVNLAGISDAASDVDLYLYGDTSFLTPLTCSPDHTVLLAPEPEDCTVTGYSTLYIGADQFNGYPTKFVLMVH